MFISLILSDEIVYSNNGETRTLKLAQYQNSDESFLYYKKNGFTKKIDCSKIIAVYNEKSESIQTNCFSSTKTSNIETAPNSKKLNKKNERTPQYHNQNLINENEYLLNKNDSLLNILKNDKSIVKIKNNNINNPYIGIVILIILSFVGLISQYIYNKRQYSHIHTKYNSKVNEYNKMFDKYKKIIDVEEFFENINFDYKNLKLKYNDGKEVYEKLKKEISTLDYDLEILDIGIYKPKYTLNTSEEFKKRIEHIRGKRKSFAKTAIYSSVSIYIKGDDKKGKKMLTTYKKVALRSFNNEANTIIKSVKWNNIDVMEARLDKSFLVINEFLSLLKMYIEEEYFQLVKDELFAKYEYDEKKKEEREKLREQRAKEREEMKAQKEFEQARIKAEEEELQFQKALELARKELGLLPKDEAKKMKDKIKELENNLKEATEAKERAISQAQLTRFGYVYIISNIGAFGEDVYKIGLTRRLEPLDRVNELGGASVPFKFDLHAMIQSKDAPTLEKELHEAFSENAVNKVNSRKEFFRISLDDIKKKVKEIDKDAEFNDTIEAQEFRQTMALINLELKNDKTIKEDKLNFPEEI